MNEEFLAAMRDAIQRGLSLVEIAEILRTFRDRGMSALSAQNVLEGMLVGADEDVDDRIREIGDIVAGWCQPHLRVWPDEPPVG